MAWELFDAGTRIGAFVNWTWRKEKGKHEKRRIGGGTGRADCRKKSRTQSVGADAPSTGRETRGSVGGFDPLLRHLFLGRGDGLVGGNLGAGFVDVVDIKDAVHGDDGRAGFGAGAFVLVNVFGGEVVVVAVDDDGGLFPLHGDFEQASERDHAFVDAVPMPGNNAAGGELDFDDGGALVGVAAQDGERDAIRSTVCRRVFLRGGFADDGFLGCVLGGDACGNKCREKDCMKERFHGCLRMLGRYVSRF